MSTATAAPPRPVALPVDAANIPAELKALPQWVMWGYRLPRDRNKWTKPPLTTSAKNAETNNAETWDFFENVNRVFGSDRVTSRKFDGFGFVFADRGGLTGVDLDDCIDQITGELHPEAAKIVAMFNTYTEISPSGTGLKLWCRGTLPTGDRGTNRPAPGWDGKVEMYQRGRFFAMTGQRWPGTPETVNDAQEAISSLWAAITPPEPPPHQANGKAHESNGHASNGKPHANVKGPGDVPDSAIIEMAFAANDNGKFERLWKGDAGNDDSGADMALANKITFWVGPDPSRIDQLFRQSGLMREKWDDVHSAKGETYGEMTIGKAIAKVSVFYDWSKYGKKKRSKKKPTVQPDNEVADHEAPSILADNGMTEIANARRLWVLHGNYIRHCAPWGKDLVWDSRRWAFDETNDVQRRAKGVAQLLWKQIGDLVDELKGDDLATVIRFAKSSSSARGIAAMLNLFRSERDIPVRPADLDQDPWLLNCLNGTVDLRTGELRPHRQADMITKLCPTPYIRDSLCPRWLALVRRSLSNNDRMVSFFQRLLGYCLTGVIREHVFPIAWGEGQNGKSTIVNAFLHVFGPDYSMMADKNMFVEKKNEGHSTERMDLFGKRFVATIETGEAQRLNEAFIKSVTGGDPIRGRRMREDTWEYLPTHKLLLATNHKPEIKGTDEGIWRRPRLIPFVVEIPKAEQDTDLPEKLKAEAPGILAWAVEGCLEWQKPTGLNDPPEVTNATNDYRRASDNIPKFIADWDRA